MKKAVFLYDRTGYMAKPWLDAGYECWLIDAQHEPGISVSGNLVKVGAWISTDKQKQVEQLKQLASEIGVGVQFVFGFPECTDLAVSGASHFNKKKNGKPEIPTGSNGIGLFS